MNLPVNTLKPIMAALSCLALAHSPAEARSTKAAYTPKVVNYSTAIPVQPAPFLLPYGYNDTARTTPQVVMAGVSPSVIDAQDTSFEILALVRPGPAAVQKVSMGFGKGNNPFLNFSFKHINTLKNGDQFWKATYTFDAGAFGEELVAIKWGNDGDAFFIQAADNAQGFNSNSFPTINVGSSPAQTAFIDTTQDDKLSYSTVKRAMPQIVMAGVSPAIVDILDSSFDIVALVRPGLIPLKAVTLLQENNNLFRVPLEKKKQFSNGDEIWVATYKFAAGTFNSSIPVVWGTEPGQYNIQVTDKAQQSSIAYPSLRAGGFPAQ